jgi:hypothetical protein
MTDIVQCCTPAYLNLGSPTETFHASIESMLSSHRVGVIGKVYDRNPDIITWYYEIFVVEKEDIRTLSGQRNKVVENIVVKKHTPVYGPVLLIKNGPAGGDWSSSPEVDVEDVARMIWWYMRTGRDPAVVFAERELERFMHTL